MNEAFDYLLIALALAVVAPLLLADTRRDMERRMEDERIRRECDRLQDAINAAAKARELQVRK